MFVLRNLVTGYCGLMAFLSGMTALLCFARWGNERKWRILSEALAAWAMMFAWVVYIRLSHNEIVRAYFSGPGKELCCAIFATYVWIPIFLIVDRKKIFRFEKMTRAYFAAYVMWIILVAGIVYIRLSHNEIVRAFFDEPWKEICYAVFAVYSLFPIGIIIERKKIFRRRPAKECSGANSL